MSRKKELAFRKQRRNHSSAILVIAVVGAFCIYIGLKSVSLLKEREELQVEIDGLNQKIEEQQARAEELEEFEKYTHTKKYAEEVAKDTLGYVYEDEIVFKPAE